jgi:methylphosphotriester-DNA--protein-cysteine methyltransferase
MHKLLKRFWITGLIVLICAFSLVAVAADCKYVGSAKSNKYHYTSCVWAQKIKSGNLVCFPSAKAAQERGYVPCKVCRPPLQDEAAAREKAPSPD